MKTLTDISIKNFHGFTYISFAEVLTLYQSSYLGHYFIIV